MTHSHRLALTGMKCASCVRKIEMHLNALPQIQRAEVNLAERTVQITSAERFAIEPIIQALDQLGYGATPIVDAAEHEHIQEKQDAEHEHQQIRQITVAAIAGVGFMMLGFCGWMPQIQNPGGQWQLGTLVLIALAVMIYSGRHFFIGAWKSLKQGSANMNSLIALGTGTAWLYSLFVVVFPFWVPAQAQHVYLEAATMILAFVNLGHLLEAKARKNTSSAIKKLMGLQAKTARIVEADGERDIPLEQVQLGDRLRVRPGERIPVDGKIVEGHSAVDEAMLTGEAIPVIKTLGSTVTGGSMNTTGSFIFVAEKIGQDTVLAQIVKMVQQGQSSKPAIARLADRIAGIFTPIVLLIALLTAVIWYWLGPDPKGLYMLLSAVSVLVIACPCALGLAIPISVIAGVGKAAQHGILIRQADAIQQSRNLTTLVFDKTGTLTEGKPKINTIISLSTLDQTAILQLAASLCSHSDHPLSSAIFTTAKEQGLNLQLVEHFQAHIGLGIEGSIHNELYYLGNLRWITQKCQPHEKLAESIHTLSQMGLTSIILASAQQVLGIIAVADPIKADSAKVIAELISDRLNIVMLTGDRQETAEVIAKQLSITRVIAEVLPQAKAAEIKRLQEQGEIVGMVGDGINDAAALAQAHVGFAMGSGSDIAIESADITLVGDSVQRVAEAIQLSKQIVGNMKQNLFGALIYNIIGIPIAAGILFPWTGELLNPMIASAAMALSSITVVLNASRLKK